MKKVFLSIFVCVFGLVLFTGCGSSSNKEASKKVTCSADLKEGEQKYGTGEIIAELDGSDKVKSVSMVMNLDSEEYAQQVYSMLALIDNFAENESDKVNAKLDGKKITVKNYEAMHTDEEDDEKIIGLSKTEFIKKIESDEEMNAKCK